ncbi:MAG: outer membrane beta-barrel protein [Bacteroidales bacterium]|nr:outer membrane beta-barrel protein [Bacteroidales bacterium]
MFYKSYSIALILVMFSIMTFAQSENDFRFKSIGLDFGWYNPSLDYWKNDSEFKDADIIGALQVRGLTEFSLKSNFTARLGLGFWQTTAEEDLQGYGLTTWSLTGYPVSLDLLYFPEPLKFSVVNPYIGVGGEFVFLQQKLRFDQKENPDPVTGTSALFSGIVGLEAKLSSQFAVDLAFIYKMGEYNQDFNVFINNPDDPENPTLKVVTEEISLTGPLLGLTFKYLF